MTTTVTIRPHGHNAEVEIVEDTTFGKVTRVEKLDPHGEAQFSVYDSKTVTVRETEGWAPEPNAASGIVGRNTLATIHHVGSASDGRVVNNVMRHAYRVLTDDEKAAMQKIKDDGLAFHDFIASLGSSRELSIAKTKIEEAVMWAVKHLTA